jgi:hypothetical protein
MRAAPSSNRRLLGVALGAALASACGGGAEPESVARELPRDLYVGLVADSDAAVALVRSDTRWAAYVCGGPSSLSSLTAWFQGTLGSAASTAGVSAELDEKRLQATITASNASGTLKVGGAEVTFTADRVADGGDAGLFQTVERGCRTGLIVPPKDLGTPQGVYCALESVGGRPIPSVFEQVTPVLPIDPNERAVPVLVGVGTAARTLFLEPVALPLVSPVTTASSPHSG